MLFNTTEMQDACKNKIYFLYLSKFPLKCDENPLKSKYITGNFAKYIFLFILKHTNIMLLNSRTELYITFEKWSVQLQYRDLI